MSLSAVKLLSVAMETRRWVLLALLLSYKIFCTAVKNINLSLPLNCPIFLYDFKSVRIFFKDFHKTSNIKFNKNLSSGSRVDTPRQKKLICTFRDLSELV